MTSIPHETPSRVGSPPRTGITIPAELWPSLAIVVVWLAVLFDAVFGPNIVTSNGSGTNTSSVPSAVVISLFAFLTSWVIARYAFRRTPTE